jgi:hypothetical protein
MHGRSYQSASTLRTLAARSRGRAAVFLAWHVAPPFILAAVHILAAGWLVIDLAGGGTGLPLQGSSALFFGCIGGWFARAAYRALSQLPSSASRPPVALRRYWRWCGACLVFCYVLALAFGAAAWAALLFWASFAACHVIVWAVLSDPRAGEAMRMRTVAPRPLRIAAWTLYPLLMLPPTCELALRLYAVAADDRLAVRYVTSLLKFPAGGQRLGRSVNSQGYWDDEFHTDDAPTALRVAALGDDAVLCGDAHSNFLAQVERLLPGVDVLNFGLREASPREYAAQFRSAVAPCRPDIVLVFFSVGTDVTEAPPLPGPFDWRGLHLVQRSLGLVQAAPFHCDGPRGCAAEEAPAADANGIDSAARMLQVCRVPVPEKVQLCWRAALAHLDRVVCHCSDAGVVPTLVIVPGEFQIDERLCRSLCRRAGYRRADQIDIDLPQRRLAAYAKDRRLHLVDLLPHMRASKMPTYASDASQFNDQGNSLTATILSEWLETQMGGTLLAGGS